MAKNMRIMIAPACLWPAVPKSFICIPHPNPECSEHASHACGLPDYLQVEVARERKMFDTTALASFVFWLHSTHLRPNYTLTVR